MEGLATHMSQIRIEAVALNWDGTAEEVLAELYGDGQEVDMDQVRIPGYRFAWIPAGMCIDEPRTGRAVYLPEEIFDTLCERHQILSTVEMIAWLQAVYGDCGDLNQRPVSVSFKTPKYIFGEPELYTPEEAQEHTQDHGITGYEEFLTCAITDYPHYLPKALDHDDVIRYASWNAYAWIRYRRHFAMPQDMKDITAILQGTWDTYKASPDITSYLDARYELAKLLYLIAEDESSYIYDYPSRKVRDRLVKSYM